MYLFLMEKEEFLKSMREYANSDFGQEHPVNSYVWRTIKRIIVENGDRVDCLRIHKHAIGINLRDENGSRYSETITVTQDNHLQKFIDFLAEKSLNTKKEKESMKDMFSFDFGKVTSDNVRVSMYGIAVKNADGRYVAYDVKTHSIMDVDIVNMPAGEFLYKMPVAIKDVKAGDVVIHNRVPMFVVEAHASTLKVVDIREGTEKEIYLTKSPFGFNFATKVVSLMDVCGVKADEDNPFGNVLPFIAMDNDKDIDPMMLALMFGGKVDMSNPMMMYWLMKGGNKGEALPFLMMGMNSAAKD